MTPKNLYNLDTKTIDHKIGRKYTVKKRKDKY